MFKMTDEQLALFNKMTALHKAVVIEHLQGHTGEEVWKRCRPDSKLVGQRAQLRVRQILRHPNVKAFIAAIHMERVSDIVMGRDEALERLTTMARGSMADLVEFGTMQVGVDAKGDPVHQAVWVFKDSALHDIDKLKTIAELAAGKEGFKMKIHSPMAAIKQLAEMQGWNAPTKVKNDHSSSDGSMSPKETVIDASKLSSEALKELLEARNNE